MLKIFALIMVHVFHCTCMIHGEMGYAVAME